MVQQLIARDDHGVEVRGPCVGFAADYTCRQCGRTGNPHSRGRCAQCVLAERVNALPAGPDGTVAPQLKLLAAAPADAPSPFPAIQWIKESPNTELLSQPTAEGHELTHDLLDALPPSRNQHYIGDYQPDQCRNSVITRRHASIWIAEEDDLTARAQDPSMYRAARTS